MSDRKEIENAHRIIADNDENNVTEDEMITLIVDGRDGNGHMMHVSIRLTPKQARNTVEKVQFALGDK